MEVLWPSSVQAVDGRLRGGGSVASKAARRFDRLQLVEVEVTDPLQGVGDGAVLQVGRIFGYHHFHSTAHEVLGIARGEVRVAFGGPSGQELTVQAGDAVVIPAGVAHRNMGQSADLLVVGAYPGGSDYDIRRGDPAEHAAAVRAIAAVPRPRHDPVLGRDGCLPRLWRIVGEPGSAQP